MRAEDLKLNPGMAIRMVSSIGHVLVDTTRAPRELTFSVSPVSTRTEPYLPTNSAVTFMATRSSARRTE
jgi:hypothetical protein